MMARLLQQLPRCVSPCLPRMLSPQHAACAARALAACNRPTSPAPQPAPHPCQLTQYPCLTLSQTGSIGGHPCAATTANRATIKRLYLTMPFYAGRSWWPLPLGHHVPSSGCQQDFFGSLSTCAAQRSRNRAAFSVATQLPLYATVIKADRSVKSSLGRLRLTTIHV